jgi:hypothetical protein
VAPLEELERTGWWLQVGEELWSAAANGDIPSATALLDQIGKQGHFKATSAEAQNDGHVHKHRLLGLEWKDANGWRALHHAARHDSSDLAEMLLSRGADPLPRDNQGRTPWELGIFGVSIPAMLRQLPALATENTTLESDAGQYKVVGAGTRCVYVMALNLQNTML